MCTGPLPCRRAVVGRAVPRTGTILPCRAGPAHEPRSRAGHGPVPGHGTLRFVPGRARAVLYDRCLGPARWARRIWPPIFIIISRSFLSFPFSLSPVRPPPSPSTLRPLQAISYAAAFRCCSGVPLSLDSLRPLSWYEPTVKIRDYVRAGIIDVG